MIPTAGSNGLSGCHSPELAKGEGTHGEDFAQTLPLPLKFEHTRQLARRLQMSNTYRNCKLMRFCSVKL